MTRRRAGSLLMTAAILANLGIVAPFGARPALANGGGPVTRYVGPVGGTGACATPTYTTGSGDYEAIAAAVTAANGGDTIHLCTHTYDLSGAGGTTEGPVQTNKPLTFEGDGTTNTIIDGGSSSGLFFSSGSSITVRDMTLQNGVSPILALNDVTAIGVVFAGNTANAAVAGSRGGAIASYGAVEVSGSTFVGNTAGSFGGAIYASNGITIRDSVFSGNQSFGSAGGAIFGYATVTVSGSRFEDNTAGTYFGEGGAIYAYDDLDVTESSFHRNVATGAGMGGALYGGAATDGRRGSVTVTGSDFSGNTAASRGGAIYAEHAVTATGGSFRDNTAENGGAIDSDDNDAVVTVRDVSFERNLATYTGGAILANGTVSVASSYFGDNAATNAFGVAGAIWANGQTDPEFAIRVWNSTFAGNWASETSTLFGLYGGILGRNLTFSGNTFGAASGNAIRVYDGKVDIGNSLFATAADACSGSLDDRGGNIAVTDGSNASGCVDAPTSQEIGAASALDLGTPALNAPGTTKTIALGATSIAAGYGVPSICADATTVSGVDQRGVSREEWGACDSGAYEVTAGPGAYVVGTGTQTCWAYGSIQAAVDSTSGGATIHLCGTHELTAGVTVAYDATFEGDASTNTFVDGGDAVRLFEGSGADLAFRDLTLQHGSVAVSGGGAMRADGISLTRVRVLDNTTGGEGGAILSFGALTVDGSYFGRNSVIDPTGSYLGGGAIRGHGPISIHASEFSGNTAVGPNTFGGAIAVDGELTITDSAFNGNTVTGDDTYGGAIEAGTGPLDVARSSFTANTVSGARSFGGAISGASGAIATSTFTANAALGSSAFAGAVYAFYTRIVASTFIANIATTSGSAIYARGTVPISNSTFVENTAGSGGGSGNGAIRTRSGSVVSISNATFHGNTGSDGYGAISALATPTVGNSIFATASDGCQGSVSDLGGNIAIGDGDDSGCILAPSQEIPDPAGLDLQPLALNAPGTTETIALGDSSLAIDNGIVSICADPATVAGVDQRGAGRTAATCDSGAYEVVTTPGAYVVGTGDQSCGAYLTIQAAVNAVTDGTTATIHVCGTHDLASTSDHPGPVTTGSRNLTFVGDSSTDTVVDGGGDRQLFYGAGMPMTATANLSFERISLRNGYASSGGAVATSGSVSASDATFIGNVATSNGGVFYTGMSASATLTRSTFRGNRAANGGVLVTGPSSVVTVVGGQFSGNRATSSGGAIGTGPSSTVSVSGGASFSENSAGTGGGAIDGNGAVSVTDGSFSDNTGGTGNGGAIQATGRIRLERSTFARNTGAVGGAISGSAIDAVNSTFVDNSAATTGGALNTSGTITTRFVTFLGNRSGTGGAEILAAIDLDAIGTIFAGGNCLLYALPNGADEDNLATGEGCSAGSTTLELLDLQPLADNGGLTRTIAITDGSAAYDAVTLENCAGVSEDQRGYPRPRGLACDAGAFETRPAPAVYIVGRTNPVGSGPETSCTNTPYSTIQDAVAAAVDTDEIHICDGIYDLSATSLTPGPVTTGPKDLTFVGDGSGDGISTIVDGGGTAQLFAGGNQALAFRSLVLRNGNATGGGSGGAVTARAVTIFDVLLSGNAADANGGAIDAKESVDSSGGTYEDNTAGSANGYGGAIYADTGSVTSLGDAFRRNSAYQSGGAIASFGSGVVAITDGTFSGNVAIGEGGAIYAYSAPVTVAGGSAEANTADSGGAIYAAGGPVSTLGAAFIGNTANRRGGAIYAYSGLVSVVGGSFAGNSTDRDGAAIYGYEGGVESSGATYSDNTAGSSSDGRGGAIASATGSVRVLNDRFLRNRAEKDGGAIWAGDSVDLTGGTFDGNSAAGVGGGIYANTGSVAATDGTFHGNVATGDAGAIYAAVRVRLERSTLDGNAGYYGGAVWAGYGGVFARNVTFAENSAYTGGAISTIGGTVTTRFVTFVDNTGFTNGILTAPYLDAVGTIFAGGACYVSPGTPMGDDNLATDDSCWSDTTTGESLDLQPLALNAPGTTETVAITDGSAAYNAVSLANCAGVGEDQRGVSRPQDGLCDMGAYELEVAGAPPPGAYVVGPGTQNCTAYATIQAAADTTSGGTIHVCGLHELTLGVILSGDFTFEGDSSTDTIVDGGDAVRLFEGGALTFRDMTLRHGTATSADPSGPNGGAIRATDVALERVRLTDNTAATNGGAIMAYGNVAMTDATFAGNRADDYGGAIMVQNDYADRTVTVSRSTFTDNQARNGGGAITVNAAHQTIDVADSRFEDNSAGTDAGAIGAYSVAGGAGSSVIDVTSSTFIANRAGARGGSIANGGTAPGTIVTTSLTRFEDGTAGTAGGAIWNAGPVTSSLDTFVGNDALDGAGGAIWSLDDLTITGSDFTANTATSWGGAAYAHSQALVDDATFDGNAATGEGGAVCADGGIHSADSLYTDNTSGNGGAVSALDDSTFLRDTFERNTATADGGAVYVKGIVGISDGSFADNSATGDGGAVFGSVFVSLTDGTFDRNSGDEGGAVIATKDGIVVLGTHFTDNTAHTTGGAIWSDGIAGVSSGHFLRNVASAGDGGAIFANGDVEVTSGVFTANTAHGNSGAGGGAVLAGGNITVRTGTFTQNVTSGSAGVGGYIRGGALAIVDGEIFVTGGYFDRNRVSGDDVRGGAIYAPNGGTIATSTFIGNRAETTFLGATAIGGAVHGGGLILRDSTFVGNGSDVSGSAAAGDGNFAVNATFVDNTAGIGDPSGAAAVFGGGWELRNVTFLRNVAPTDKAGALQSNFYTIANTIFGSASDACYTASGLNDLGGNIEVGDSATCIDTFGAQAPSRLVADGSTLEFGELAANAPGKTRTVAISDGSIAVGYGLGVFFGTSDLVCLDDTNTGSVGGVDQRGVSRSSGDQTGSPCDSGAYENTTGIRVEPASPATVVTRVSRATATNVDPFWDTATVSGSSGDGAGGFVDPVGHVQFYLCYSSVSSGECDWAAERGTWTPFGDPIELSAGSSATDGIAAPVTSDTTTGADGWHVFHASFVSDDTDVYLDGEDDGTNETVRVAPTQITLAYTGPVIVYTANASTAVALTAQVSPNTHCPVRFWVDPSSGVNPTGPYTVWTSGNGVATTAPIAFPIGTYGITVTAVPGGPCAGAPDYTGTLTVAGADLGVGKGGTGGGWYKVDGARPKVGFGWTVRVTASSAKSGRTTTVTTSTKGNIIWTSQRGWRLKGTVDFSSTDGSSPWQLRSCVGMPASAKCATFAGTGVLQSYSEASGGWVTSSFGRVSFVVSVSDGGSASVCKGSGKLKSCSTVDLADYLGITMSYSTPPTTTPITVADGIPVNTGPGIPSTYQLQQGSLKVY